MHQNGQPLKAGHPLFLFDWLKNYQDAAAEGQRFKGVHLDVEPYLYLHGRQRMEIQC